MDKLEKFISENRGDFNSFDPSPTVWDKLDARLENRSHRPVMIRRIAAAASVIILIGLSFIAGMYIASPDEKTSSIAARERNELPVPDWKPETPVPLVKESNVLQNQSPVLVQQTTTRNTNKDGKLLYGEADAYYRQTMFEQRRQIAVLSGNNPSVLRSVNEEFISLDSTIKVLAQDLGDNVNNVEVVEAIVQNYRMRIEMLNMMIQQLKETNYENDKTIEL